MRPLITRSDSLYASRAPLAASRSRSGLALGLPFGLGAVTLGLLGVGSWALPARAQGAAEEAPTPLVVDTVNGPIVAILSPHYNDQLKGAAQVLVAVQGRKNTPRTIELFVDGRSDTKGPIDLPGIPSSNFSWDTSRFSDGLHRLTVVITDTQGFRGSADVNVYINNNKIVDASPPSLEWLNVREKDAWAGMVELKVKAVDNFGVKFLIVSLNPAATPLKKPAAFSWFLNRPPYAINFDSRKAPDGLYSLRATAYDALENEGLAPAVTISINNHSINPTYKLPDAPRPMGPRVLAETAPGMDPNAAGRTGDDGSAAGEMRLDTVPSGAPSKAAPARNTKAAPGAVATLGNVARGATSPRVATAPARPVGPPVLSSVPSTGEASAPAVAQAPASTWVGAHSLSGSERVAAVDAVPRVLKRAPGTAAMSRADMTPRDGYAMSAAPSRSASAAAPAPRASAPLAPARTSPAATSALGMAAKGQPKRAGAPALSMAPVAQGPGAAVAASGVASNSDRKLVPVVPSGLARVPGRVAAAPAQAGSQPMVSNGGETVVPKGSPAAPTFPSVDLNRRAPSGEQRSSTPPAVAMAPPSNVIKRMGESAITVAPAISSTLPTLHRALRGETLASVAGRYKLPVAVLAMHNHLAEDSVLKAGQEVRLPQTLAVSMAGELVQGDVSSMMVDSVGVTPFRFLFEKQGGKLEWDAAHKRVTAQNATHQVTLTIGSKSAMVNEKEVMMDLAAFLVSGRTMVPLRFFEKALNASVEWEPATGRLLVAMAQ